MTGEKLRTDTNHLSTIILINDTRNTFIANWVDRFVGEEDRKANFFLWTLREEFYATF